MLNNWWGLCKDNQKRIFIIPVGKMSKEEAEKQLQLIKKSYNAADNAAELEIDWRDYMIREKQKNRKEKLQKIEENSTTNYYLPHCKKCGDLSFEAHDNPNHICARCELKEKREKRKEKIEEIIKNNKKIDET